MGLAEPGFYFAVVFKRENESLLPDIEKILIEHGAEFIIETVR